MDENLKIEQKIEIFEPQNKIFEGEKFNRQEKRKHSDNTKID